MSAQVRGYHFYHREEVRSGWNYETALAFLRGFREDAVALRSLRELAGRGNLDSPMGEMTPDRLLEQVARMLERGQLVMAAPKQRRRAATNYGGTPEPAPIPEPIRRVAAFVVPEDPPTLGPNLHALLQAATLLAASERGLPFCEECLRLGKKTA